MVILLCSLLLGADAGTATPPKPDSARQLLLMVQYVASDYAYADDASGGLTNAFILVTASALRRR